jgi:hypothetical protein
MFRALVLINDNYVGPVIDETDDGKNYPLSLSLDTQQSSTPLSSEKLGLAGSRRLSPAVCTKTREPILIPSG